MKLIKIFVAAQLLLLLGVGAVAQQGQFKIDLNYQAGLPVGKLKDVVEETSWRGGEIGFMYGVSDAFSVGLAFGSQDFYQKYPRTVLRSSGQDVSAVISNSIQVMPVMARASMKLAPMGPVQPFVSLGVGGNFIQYRKFYGEFADSRSTFGFAAQPSVGVHVPFSKRSGAGFHIAGGFNYMPFKYNDVDGLHHAVVKAGISVPLQ
jgi:hypothetical protein